MANSIVFIDCYGDLAERFTPEMQNFLPELKVIYGKPFNEKDIIKRIGSHTNILVYMAFISHEILNSCKNLKSIAYLSTGLKTHGDLETAKSLGIKFEGVKDYGNIAVAEHTITLALASLKRIVEMDNIVRSSNWSLLKTEEFSSKTFGLIGFGGIGKETAKMASALGARTIAWNRTKKELDGVEFLPLDRVLSESDILSFHLALNDQTISFLDDEKLFKTKKGVIFVNTSRAEIFNEKTILKGLSTGHIKHCAMDVFHEEPLPKSHPFINSKFVTLTPHSAWVTSQAIDRLLWSGLKLLKIHSDEQN